MPPKGFVTKGPRGLMFRSRAEATWAHFFEALSLDWSYEPVTFDEPAYLPDFAVEVGAHTVYVEIKGGTTNLSELSRHLPKMRGLGDRPYFIACARCFVQGDRYIVGVDRGKKEVAMCTCSGCETTSFTVGGACAACGSTACAPSDPVKLLELWSTCQNTTQWQPAPKKRRCNKKRKKATAAVAT
jgi:hypothetical protein